MMKRIFKKNYNKIPEAERLSIIERASKQVSRGVFFSTIIIITSFLPVFLLTGQEGKLFHPLAFTKTFIMIVDAILVVTLAPVLISFFMKGRFRPESANPINRFLERVYEPVIRRCIKWRKTTIAVNVMITLREPYSTNDSCFINYFRWLEMKPMDYFNLSAHQLPHSFPALIFVSMNQMHL